MEFGLALTPLPDIHKTNWQMTEDQIKAIAEEYANSSINEYSTGVDKDAAKSLASDLKQFLTFLSTRYCIVEREKVMEEYEWYAGSLNWSECTANEDVAESFHTLFGTSMFN